MTQATTAGWRALPARLRARLGRRHPGLLRRRAHEALPVVLGQRRIYVLPTRFGIGFGTMLIVMLLGALNYNNNAALLLTCLLGAASAQSMYGAFRALHGLCLETVRAEPVEAGQALTLVLQFSAAPRAHPGLRLDTADHGRDFSLPTGEVTRVALMLHTERRGWMALPALKLQSTWPFGLFRAWSWLRPDTRVLVYPAREATGPAAAGAETEPEPAQRDHEHGEDYAGLREYRPGDSPRRIAWKASARSDTLLLRLHEPPARPATWLLRWQDIRGLDDERRIMRLARWVDEAYRAGQRWQLDLPGQVLGPDAGETHYHASMTALALLP